MKEAKGLLKYFDGTLQDALVDSFPDIKVAGSKFVVNQKNYWQNRDNRKVFAKSNGIDPLSPTSWYKIDREQFISTREDTI